MDDCRKKIAPLIRGELKRREVSIISIAKKAGLADTSIHKAINGQLDVPAAIGALQSTLGFDPWARWLEPAESNPTELTSLGPIPTYSAPARSRLAVSDRSGNRKCKALHRDRTPCR